MLSKKIDVDRHVDYTIKRISSESEVSTLNIRHFHVTRPALLFYQIRVIFAWKFAGLQLNYLLKYCDICINMFVFIDIFILLLCFDDSVNGGKVLFAKNKLYLFFVDVMVVLKMLDFISA